MGGGNGRRHDDAVVVGTVHRAAGKGGDTMDRKAVGPLLRPAAQGVQQGGGGLQPVALLDAEPGGIDEMRGPVPHRSHHRQGWQQVRTA